ncbi:glycosyltransferase family 77 protein [Synechococcus sp. BSF8S]|uniref:putative nucleotide-diphospho-sugar transferase n=1 Tax=Synechococcales TaxID=1890424 RepID=UPI001626BA40|nr:MULTISPECIES: putative nucleotide-diphospho-sugar transferase [unclassified Synechococcus]MBC1262225.1 glycosyltransferase family 77 protein [Synechococcus sp. BSF8S]MBC1265110.1 glycosyltransferase family 77 protein [Synechococcus sp. BSA11S]
MSPPLHVVYCLTSSGGDLYEAMTRVSLGTVRLTNPTARIEIACDQQTHQALQATGSQLLREADAVHGFPTPDGPPTFRNRFVKTTLRLLLRGPFLFLDSDTVVRKPLTLLLNLHADIAAAPNHSADTLAEQIWSEDQANLDTMGWQVREPYVNGGVIWHADTPAAHRFAEAWHCNWLANVERTGRYRDQPALNNALSADQEIKLQVLPHSCNAQVGMRPDLAEAALIWHIYSSTGLSAQDRFSHCCRRVLEGRSRHLPSRPISGLVKATTPNRTPSLATQLRFRFKSKLQSLIKAG